MKETKRTVAEVVDSVLANTPALTDCPARWLAEYRRALIEGFARTVRKLTEDEPHLRKWWSDCGKANNKL